MKLKIESCCDRVDVPYFYVTVEKEDGEGISKVLTYEALCHMLTRNRIDDTVSVSVPRLPQGYLGGRFDNNGGGCVVVYVPETERVMLFAVDGQKMPVAFKIPIPPMIFDVSYSASGHASGSCFCVDGSFDEVCAQYELGKLPLFQYPFGNVNTRGSICMGNIQCEVNTAKDVGLFIESFFDGITNHHYMDDAHSATDMTQFEMCQALQGKDKFPKEWLLPMKDVCKKL